MLLEELGWDSNFESHLRNARPEGSAPARVAAEWRGCYRVFTAAGPLLAEVTGRLRREAETGCGLPAVGDWVGVAPRPAGGRAAITAILPRRTALSRKAAGRAAREQVLAANVDEVFIVTSLNQEFNLRRLERYLAAAWASGARPVVLLNKADLCADPAGPAAEAERVAGGVPVHVLSAVEGEGLEAVRGALGGGRTGVFIGSSGVGKSTIINALSGGPAQATRGVRAWDDRGRHTTTARQMFVLAGGGVVVDTPGLRELQLWEGGDNLAQTFEDLEALARRCRFHDCRHQSEPGCAVKEAVQEGAFDAGRFENYLKMERELSYLAAKTDDEARARRNRDARQACKLMKQFPEKY